MTHHTNPPLHDRFDSGLASPLPPQHACSTPGRSAPAIDGASVSLKIGRTSVMLYRNEYLKPAGNRPGCSVQDYLGSFSVHATEIPPAFDALLRRATSGRPERYRALLERLEERVLAPARRRHAEQLRQQQHDHILGLLGFAQQQLQAVSAVPDPLTHLVAAEVRDAVAQVVHSAQQLQVMPGTAFPATSPEAGDTPARESNTASGVAPVEPPDEAPDVKTPEERLQALLMRINGACQEISSMMPEAAKQFRRGYPFQDQTVELVRQLWFNSSDAIAALNGRGQLKRPKVWETLRAEVLSGAPSPQTPEASCCVPPGSPHGTPADAPAKTLSGAPE